MPKRTDIVLIGGGHAHVGVLKSFGMRPLDSVRLTLIGRDAFAPYSGMLPGVIAGHYDASEAHLDLQKLCRFAGAAWVHDSANGLDLARGEVHFENRPPLSFDITSIDIGSAPGVETVSGAAGRVTPVKPIAGLTARWNDLRRAMRAAQTPQRIGVVGGGAGGAELILSLREALYDEAPETTFHLVTASDRVLPRHPAAASRAYASALATRSVTAHTSFLVCKVTDNGVVAEDGRTLDLDAIFWVTDAAAQPFLKDAGLAVDEKGFVVVNEHLQSVSHPTVFAAGDIAEMLASPRPKAGVFAVRQGPVLARNLRRAAEGRPLKSYRPQKDFLSIISTGDKHAIASRGPFCVAGAWVWRLKDQIDRRWMRQYQELPDMAAPDETEMRCGGCGAKIGADIVSKVISEISPAARSDVLSGISNPDDAALTETPAGMANVHTIDGFRPIVDDLYLYGRIVANHCLNDIFAMGAEPQSALAMVTLPFADDQKLENDLRLLLNGVNDTLRQEGAALIGGHTAEGAELSLSLSAIGLIEKNAALKKSGLKPGDALILTKPLGTGTLFAAHMRAKANGGWITGAVDMMLQSNAAAARNLKEWRAHASTDITGFGLAGHLFEMLSTSHVSAKVYANRLPLLDGAQETLDAKLYSTLHDQNKKTERHIDGAAPAILFDPQTAGGLLFGMPANTAQTCLKALKALGYTHSAIIGDVIETPPGARDKIVVTTADTPS
ncbi:MAG: selenide, water dikinase SelD [Pseudomonadota bacterium]